MTLNEETGSGFAAAPFHVYDGTNWVGKPMFQWDGSNWIDAYLDDGLVAYYPFDGDVNDYSGLGNDGTDNTSAGYNGSGRVGSDSKDFDGVDDGIPLPNNIVSTSDWSVSVWAYPRTVSSGSTTYIFHHRNGTSFILGSDDTNDNIKVYDGSSWNDTSTDFDLNSWQHLIVTASDGGNLICYKNNLQIYSTSYSQVTESDGNIIGKSDSSASYWDGLIGTTRIYNRSISSAERDSLYQQGKVI